MSDGGRKLKAFVVCTASETSWVLAHASAGVPAARELRGNAEKPVVGGIRYG